jgi:hypothetical protein
MNYIIWISILFSPLFNLGVTVRADQLLCPIYFLVYLVAHRKLRGTNPGARTIMLYALASAAASLAGVLMTDGSMGWTAVKWPAVFVTNIMAAYSIVWSSDQNRPNLYRQNLKILQRLMFAVGLIGLLQVAEHRNLLRSSYVTNALADFYPYWGELTDSAYEKSFGRQLKVGGAGQLTSVVDGHPILAGDLLAFGSLITMPLCRGQRGWLLHIVPVVALMLTLSRGSIVPWFVGLMVYCYLIMRHSSVTRSARKNAALRLIGLAAILGLVILTPLGEGILWRIESSIHTFQGSGVRDGRTEGVWPVVMDMLQQSSNLELLFGQAGEYDGPTDSQYLFTLVNQGLVGVVVLLAFHLALLFWAHKYATNCIREKRSPELAFAFIAALSALMMIYTVHPAYQNRRLLTLIVVVTVTLFQAAPKLSSLRCRKDFRREAYCRPSLHRA